MRIKWYGTASLLIEGGATRVLVDPYLKLHNRKLFRVPVEEGAGADAALITHPHFDHFRDVGAFLNAGLPCVYVSENGIRIAERNGIPADKMLAVAAGDRFQIGEIGVRVFQSRHCVFDGATLAGIVLSPRTYFNAHKAVALLKEMKRYKIGDDVYAFGLTHGDKTVFILGSAGTDGDTQYPTGADLLVFPYQGRTKMYRYMRPFLKELQPKSVFADHFDDAFPPFTHKVNMEKVMREAEAFGIKATVPKEGEWYEV